MAGAQGAGSGCAAILLSVLAVAAVAGPARAGDETERLLDDFTAPELKSGWKAEHATIRRVESRGGGALEVSGFPGGKAIASRVSLPIADADVGKYGALSFRCAVPDRTVRVGILLRCGGGVRMLWNYVDVPKGEERVVEVPFNLFEDESQELWAGPRRVTALEFAFKDAQGTVLLDDVRLLPVGPGRLGFRLTIPEIGELAFGKAVRPVESRTFALLTDLPALQGTRGTKYLSDLEEGVTALGERFGLKGTPEGKCPLLVFRGPAPAEAFCTALSKRFGTTWTQSEADAAAFCHRGLTITFATEGSPTTAPYLPPVAHECLHPFVRQHLGVASNSWIQEGIVTSIHRRMYPDYYEVVRDKFRPVSAESFRLVLQGGNSNLRPLAPYLAQDGYAFQDFGQLGSVFDFLVAKHRASIPKVLDAFRALEASPGKAGLAAMAGALGMTPEEFEKAWLQWGAASFK